MTALVDAMTALNAYKRPKYSLKQGESTIIQGVPTVRSAADHQLLCG